jgi:hypothetical protein
MLEKMYVETKTEKLFKRELTLLENLPFRREMGRIQVAQLYGTKLRQDRLLLCEHIQSSKRN